jgi:WD40 repeat protein
MAATEADTSRDRSDAPSANAYDGFISYSHAADDLLAPRLQTGLQRFAKPWWKRRALRIFRDESSLAANPHLWSSIVEALDGSYWFVLLLSEDAAASEWVGKEIEHWVEHKDSNRILPVVTDGEFGWANGDVTGSSVPPALHGVFAEEPRWVDLRFARGETDLDLKDPRFADAVADVASALRGIPKDELASEEVRQHRRTVRTAWIATILIGVLAISAITALVFAIGQRDRARVEALLASAQSQLDSDPELAALLALEAIDLSAIAKPAGTDILVQALLDHRTIAAFPVPDRPGPFANHAMSPSAQQLASWDWTTGRIRYQAIPDGDVLWEVGGNAEGHLSAGAISGDGQLLYVLDSGWQTENGSATGSIVVFETESGEYVERIDVGPCPMEISAPVGDSVDPGSVVVVEWANPVGENCDARNRTVGTVELSSGTITVLAERSTGPDAVGQPTMNRQLSLLAVGNLDSVVIIDTATREEVQRFEKARISSLDETGSRILIGDGPVELRDVESGELLAALPVSGAIDAKFLRGNRLMVSGTDGIVRVFDLDGGLLFELRGHTSPVSKMSPAIDGTATVTESEDGLRLWDLSNVISPGNYEAVLPAGIVGTWPYGMMASGGGLNAIPFNSASGNSQYAVLDGEGRRVRIASDVGPFALSSDGSFIVEEPWDLIETPAGIVGGRGEPLVVVDARSGEMLKTLEGCSYRLQFEQEALETEPGCPTPITVSDLDISRDGKRVAAAGGFWHFAVWDLDSGRIVWETDRVNPPFIWDHEIALSPDGSEVIRLDLAKGGLVSTELATGETTAPIGEVVSSSEMLYHPNETVAFVAEQSGNALVIDTDQWSIRSELSNPIAGPLTDLAISPDAEELAVVSIEGYLVKWDWRNGVRTAQYDVGIPLAHVTYTSEDLIAVGVDGAIVRIPQKPDTVAVVAEERLTREFTALECATYRIDRCPADPVNEDAASEPSGSVEVDEAELIEAVLRSVRAAKPHRLIR